jgi:hypothetical protein
MEGHHYDPKQGWSATTPLSGAYGPPSRAQRPPRIAALERELEELHRIEEALVATAIAAGQPVHRSPSAPPAAVLGVRMADKVSRAA